MDGRSLVPLLRGETPDDWRESLLIEYNTDTVFPRLREMGYRAVRTPRWKFIRYNALEDMDELYDLQSDPYEMHNLIHKLNLQPVRQELKSELDRLASGGE
jgi:choline-sulfatase